MAKDFTGVFSTRTPFFGVGLATAAMMAASAGAATYTYSTAGSQAAVTLVSGDTINLRNDAASTFTPASITLPASGDTVLNIDVNNATSATNQTLTLGGTLTFASGSATTTSNTINVTGGNGYALGLGNISVPSGSGTNANHQLTLNAASANVSTGTVTLGSYGETLTLAGSQTISLGSIQQNSNGSNVINFGTGTDSPTVILSSAGTASGSRTTGSLVVEIKSGAVVQLNAIDALKNTNSSSSATALSVDTGGQLILSDTATDSYTSQTLSGNVTLNGGKITNYQNLNSISTLTVGAAGGTLQGSFSNLSGNRRSLNVATLNGTGNLTVGDSGLGGTDPNAGSIVRFTSATGGNYSGTITVNGSASAGGSYVFIDGASALAGATVNVASDNTAASPVFLTNNGTAALAFNTGTVNIGALSGSGTVRLNVVADGSSVTLAAGANNASTTYSGTMRGIGKFTKTGTGTLVLSGTNTYTGGTTVNGGTLVVGSGGTGSLGATAVAVNSGATLAGSGSLGGIVTVASGGTLSPGNSVGGQTAAGVKLSDGGNLNWQIADASSSAAAGYDVFNVGGSGTLDLSALTGANKFNINLWSVAAANADTGGDAAGFNPNANQTWTLIATNSAIANFSASKFAVNTAANNGTSGFSNAAAGTFSVGLSSDGTDLVLNYAVPEPAMLGVIATAAVGMLQRRRRA